MQSEFLEKLDISISKLYHSDMNVLLGGDFNIIMNGELDYMGPKTISKTRFNEKFEEFLYRYKLYGGK